MDKNQKIALIVLGVITGVFLMSSKISRGIRNNNPGNIRKSGDDWKGLSPEQTDKSFFQFVSPVFGIRALSKILKNYQSMYHLKSVNQIINRYAPPTENDSISYILNVANKMGVDPHEPISLKDENKLFQMVSAIIVHENGSNPYDVETTFEAIRMV